MTSAVAAESFAWHADVVKSFVTTPSGGHFMKDLTATLREANHLTATLREAKDLTATLREAKDTTATPREAKEITATLREAGR